jgi:hypothetical protein
VDAEFSMGVTERPNIRIEEFFVKYRPVVEGSSELKAIEYCRWAPKGQKLSIIEDRIKDLKRDAVMWPVIQPHYLAWQKGQEITDSGTALEVWPALSKEQIKVLKSHDVRTIEDVAEMLDSQRAKIGLPGMVSLQQAAKRFLEARVGDRVETALAQKDREISDLKAKMDEMMEFMRAQAAAAPEMEAPKRGPGRPRKDEMAA